MSHRKGLTNFQTRARAFLVVVIVVVIKATACLLIVEVHIGDIVAAKAIGVATARVVFTASHVDPFVDES
jgi:hypothetical protein